MSSTSIWITGLQKIWWTRRDSNSHALLHMLLRHTCIPIPPLVRKRYPSLSSTASDFCKPPHRTSLYASSAFEIFLVYDKLSTFSHASHLARSLQLTFATHHTERMTFGKCMMNECIGSLGRAPCFRKIIRLFSNEFSSLILENALADSLLA